MFKENTMWVGVPRSEIEKNHILEGDLTGRFAYFRYTCDLLENASLVLNISANSRYRLWINGSSVTAGPCKGDLERQYYDTVDVSKYLQIGKNVIAVQVLYQNIYDSIDTRQERTGIYAIVSHGGGHRLAIEGTVIGEDGKIITSIDSGTASWKVLLDTTQYVRSKEPINLLGAIIEEVDFNKIRNDWKQVSFDDKDWAEVSVIEPVLMSEFDTMVGWLNRFQIKDRPIPLLFESEYDFDHTYEDVDPESGRKRIVFDAGKIVNAYPIIVLDGKKDAKVEITYLEKFEPDSDVVRRDYKTNGRMTGFTDCVILPGYKITFEPFWVRTFRFICIECEQEDSFAFIRNISYIRTGYPLNPESEIHASADWVEKLWNMCVNTLQNCMLETFMDCPYYEQMQYPMDTRLQALFCYSTSRDIHLAHKALEDFHCSMRQDGLILGKAPTAYPQVISTFSLYYIFMIREYYDQTGKLEEVRRYFPDIDRILDYYDQRIGEDGMVGHPGYWPFVDWQKAWTKTGGVPAALAQGPSTIINLMYAYALKDAAYLNKMRGRDGLAEEYMQRRANILNRVKDTCWDSERELFREGPNFKQYSRHAQAWAVLNDMVEQDLAKTIILHAAEEADVLKCSFSTSYEWFRACEKAGIYEVTKVDMQDWIDLIDLGCTCCPETPEDSRSECHAWSALPLYEMMHVLVGINNVTEDGKIYIKPQLEQLEIGDHPYVNGKAVTPMGVITFDYQGKRNEDGNIEWIYALQLPDGVKAVVEYPDGKIEVVA